MKNIKNNARAFSVRANREKPPALAAKAIGALVIISLLLTAAAGEYNPSAAESAAAYTFAAEDFDATIPTNATRILLDGASAVVEGAGAAANDQAVLITQPGTYILTGEAQGLRIVIDAKKDDIVRLALSNASITYDGGAAIYGMKAGRIVLILPDGTENHIAGGCTIDEDAAEPDEEEEANQAVIFAKNDIVITGSGSLAVQSAGYGIWAKDMLILTGGLLDVDAVETGMRGSDGVAAINASAIIKSGGDGLKSTKSDDPTVGFVQLENCYFNITAGNDGIQAESELRIISGDYEIITGDGAGTMDQASTGRAPALFGGAGGGDPSQAGADRRQNASWDGFFGGTPAETEVEPEPEISVKGLKAGTLVTLLGGAFTFDTQDDAIHSNADIFIGGGSYEIRTGDDAVHADGALTLAGGAVNIAACYEGLEGASINFTGGEYTIIASDDAINLADGTAGARGGRMGASGERLTMTIAGGLIRATGGGDTVDANGNIEMSGGDLYLSGMSMGMEGTVDFDGTFTVTGGSLITAGSVMSASNASTQPVLLVSYSESVAAGSVIELRDSSTGEAILSYVSETACTTSGFTSPKLALGQPVSVWIDGAQRLDITLSESTAVNTAAEGGGAYGLQGGGRGGWGGGFMMPGAPNQQPGGGRRQPGATLPPDTEQPIDPQNPWPPIPTAPSDGN
ncbi:MAG: carbohydrate-binding domain-containing protein [Oscillospiraceae bacterium]|jgi:phage baseplate assembly protein gpV|nr:carbohydrate-binding domain-containing protein [Oscillospiraceae bacterium]